MCCMQRSVSSDLGRVKTLPYGGSGSVIRAYYFILLIITNSSEKVNRMFSRKWGKTVDSERKFGEIPGKFEIFHRKALAKIKNSGYSLTA